MRVCLSALFAKHPTKPLDREKPKRKRGKRIIKKEEEREEAENIRKKETRKQSQKQSRIRGHVSLQFCVDLCVQSGREGWVEVTVQSRTSEFLQAF